MEASSLAEADAANVPNVPSIEDDVTALEALMSDIRDTLDPNKGPHWNITFDDIDLDLLERCAENLWRLSDLSH